MRDLLDDLESLGDVTQESLTADRLRRRAVERILTQLVEIATSINSHVASAHLGKVAADYRESFDLAVAAQLIPEGLATALKPSVGPRNVLTHEYVDVDLAIVARAVGPALADYWTYVRTVASWLGRRTR